MGEFKSFFKTVTGNEGQKCNYPTRLDTYGCGCQHNCSYCYARSLLEFRNLWHPSSPSVADITKIEARIKLLPSGTVLRLGGMTDCFQACEKEYGVTYKTIELLNKHNIHYLIVTKSDLVADDKYIAIMNKKLAHIQITLTSTDDDLAATYENAPAPSKRIEAIEKLAALGFDVQIRLSPFIPEYLDFSVINKIKCDKAIVEFLRVNTFIRRTFPQINYSLYTHKESGYYHLELNTKTRLLRNITGFRELSVCEDCTEAYNYWKSHVNFNSNDCCNLRFDNADPSVEKPHCLGNIGLLNVPMVAYLCSEKASENAGTESIAWAKKQAKDAKCIVSGFQSKIEREVLDQILQNKGKAVWLLANRIFKDCPKKYQESLDEGRLLIVSYFDDSQTRVTRESAEQRNSKVVDLADRIVVGCIKRGGLTEKLISQAKKPCFILDTVRRE